MKEDIKQTWNSVMTVEGSSLKNLDPMVAHLIFQVLAYMWCAIFALWVGSVMAFGISGALHSLLIGGAFITAIVHRQADRK